jgi:hypothetical protein
LTPLDIWALGQRMTGKATMQTVYIMLAISFGEDVPQLSLGAIYMSTMRAKGIEPDTVAKISTAASSVSLLFNIVTIIYYVSKLRKTNPIGWCKVEQSDEASKVVALEAENASLRKQLLTKNTSASTSRTVTSVMNPAYSTTTPPDDRCGKCNAKKQFCTCDVRRNTIDMSNGRPDKKCTQKTSAGTCPNMARTGNARCSEHTCQHAGCSQGKSSKVKFCNAHSNQTSGKQVDAYLDVMGADSPAESGV